MLREAYDQASNYLQYFAQDNRPMTPENVRPFLVLVLFCFTIFVAFFHPNFFIPQILNVVFLIFF